MAEEEHGSKIEQLRSGEKVLCDKCRKGYFIPYNTTADKAHAFNCSNPDCGNYIQFDAVIDIE